MQIGMDNKNTAKETNFLDLTVSIDKGIDGTKTYQKHMNFFCIFLNTRLTLISILIV